MASLAVPLFKDQFFVAVYIQLVKLFAQVFILGTLVPSNLLEFRKDDKATVICVMAHERFSVDLQTLAAEGQHLILFEDTGDVAMFVFHCDVFSSAQQIEVLSGAKKRC